MYYSIKSEHKRKYISQVTRSSGNTVGNRVAYLPLHKFVGQAWLELKANEMGEYEQFSCEMIHLECIL